MVCLVAAEPAPAGQARWDNADPDRHSGSPSTPVPCGLGTDGAHLSGSVACQAASSQVTSLPALVLQNAQGQHGEQVSGRWFPFPGREAGASTGHRHGRCGPTPARPPTPRSPGLPPSRGAGRGCTPGPAAPASGVPSNPRRAPQESHLKGRVSPSERVTPRPSGLFKDGPPPPFSARKDGAAGLEMAQASGFEMCLGQRRAVFRGDKIFTRTQPCFRMIINYFNSAFAKGYKNSHNIFFSLDSRITSVTANAIMICFKCQCLSCIKLILYIFPVGRIVVNEIKHTNRICPQGTRN